MFFGRFGKEIPFHDTADLESKWKEIDLSVPGRTEGRKSHHRERYCLALYLRTRARHCLLPLPFRVMKCEAPDFLLETDSSLIALEHTDIGTERSQRAATELERFPFGTLLEDEDSFRGPNEPLRGRGYVGDQAARELVPLLIHALGEKTHILNEKQFRVADRYDLLLYDMSHLGRSSNRKHEELLLRLQSLVRSGRLRLKRRMLLKYFSSAWSADQRNWSRSCAR